MTRIDQRILIPAAPQVVWEYIKQIDNLPDWQVNCETIAYLSQKQRGPGTRWRQRAPNRQEFVYEMTTWYDGLGFEYVFVDGSSFQEARGRIRLQEIAEGTIVQWTFEYELGGVLSGLRNTLSKQRRIESDMVDSLKELWKQSKRKGGLEGFQAKSLMQDGEQDPEKRSHYTPRHDRTEKPEPEQPKQTAEVAAAPSIDEPPVSEDDTRPRPSVDPSVHMPDESDAPEEPKTVTATENVSEADDYARFAPPTNVPSDAEPQDMPQPDATTPDEDVTLPAADLKASAASLEADSDVAAENTTQDAPQPRETLQSETPPPDEQDAPDAQAETPPTEEPTASSDGADEPTDAEPLEPQVPPGTDTSDLSIWEIFGIPSPTDTQKMRAVEAAKQAEREYEEEQSSSAESPAPTATDSPDSYEVGTAPPAPAAHESPDSDEAATAPPAADMQDSSEMVTAPPAATQVNTQASEGVPQPPVDEPSLLDALSQSNHEEAPAQLGRTGLRQQMRHRRSNVRHPQ